MPQVSTGSVPSRTKKENYKKTERVVYSSGFFIIFFNTNLILTVTNSQIKEFGADDRELCAYVYFGKHFFLYTYRKID